MKGRNIYYISTLAAAILLVVGSGYMPKNVVIGGLLVLMIISVYAHSSGFAAYSALTLIGCLARRRR